MGSKCQARPLASHGESAAILRELAAGRQPRIIVRDRQTLSRRWRLPWWQMEYLYRRAEETGLSVNEIQRQINCEHMGPAPAADGVSIPLRLPLARDERGRFLKRDRP